MMNFIIQILEFIIALLWAIPKSYIDPLKKLYNAYIEIEESIFALNDEINEWARVLTITLGVVVTMLFVLLGYIYIVNTTNKILGSVITINVIINIFKEISEQINKWLDDNL